MRKIYTSTFLASCDSSIECLERVHVLEFLKIAHANPTIVPCSWLL